MIRLGSTLHRGLWLERGVADGPRDLLEYAFTADRHSARAEVN